MSSTKPTLYQQAKDLGVTEFGKPYNRLTKEDLLRIINEATPVPTIEVPSLVISEESISGESIPVEIVEPTIEVPSLESSPVPTPEPTPQLPKEIILEGVSELNEKNGFRLQNQRYLLTYKTHLSKVDIVAFFGEKNAKETIAAHEVASSETNYEHTHVYVDFGKSYQSKNARIFDINLIHPNIKVIKTAKHLENIWSYLCKEDHENDYLLSRLTTKTLVDRVWEKESINDVLKMATRPNDVSGLVALYGFKKHQKKDCSN